MRHIGRFSARLDPPPGRKIGQLDMEVIEPCLDMEMQQLRAVGEPALALRGESQQYILEPAKRALAVDGDQQAFAQRQVGNSAHKALHPAILLA